MSIKVYNAKYKKCIFSRFSGDLGELVASGQVDLEALGRAVLMQKVLSATGLSPEHLAKALVMQKAMLDAGASSEHVANCMQKALLESGWCSCLTELSYFIFLDHKIHLKMHMNKSSFSFNSEKLLLRCW